MEVANIIPPVCILKMVATPVHWATVNKSSSTSGEVPDAEHQLEVWYPVYLLGECQLTVRSKGSDMQPYLQ